MLRLLLPTRTFSPNYEMCGSWNINSELPKNEGLNDRKDQILWCQGLAFNFIRKKPYVERKRKQPAVKHIKTVDNSVIIFYFLDHFLFYLFESVFQPFVRGNKNRNMWDAASWCVIYINLNTAQDSSRSFSPISTPSTWWTFYVFHRSHILLHASMISLSLCNLHETYSTCKGRKEFRALWSFEAFRAEKMWISSGNKLRGYE